MKQVADQGCILLVDDDDTFRQVMSDELSRRGHAVATAPTAQAALEQALKDAFDVILLDLHLPDLDGIEVLGQLRALEVPAGVIVLTGHGTIDTAIQAIRIPSAQAITPSDTGLTTPSIRYPARYGGTRLTRVITAAAKNPSTICFRYGSR